MNHRLLSLDLIKLVAMFSVICLHTEMSFYDNSVARFLYMTAVVAIPMFFMTSGYLLYGKESVDYHYACRKIVGILRFVAIVTIAFWLLFGLRHGIPFWLFTFGSLLQEGGLGIFWYFGAMILLYALLPLQHKLYRENPNIFYSLTAILCLLANAIFIANFFGLHIESNTIQTFRLWNWIFYFNIGGIIRKYKPKVNGLLIVIFLIINYLFQYSLTPLMPTVYCEYFYSSMPVMLLSISIFIYLLSISETRLHFINGGGKLFLPVYTFHPYIIGKTEHLFEQYIYSECSYFAPLYWIIVSILSIILAWFVIQIPYMNKIFRI